MAENAWMRSVFFPVRNPNLRVGWSTRLALPASLPLIRMERAEAFFVISRSNGSFGRMWAIMEFLAPGSIDGPMMVPSKSRKLSRRPSSSRKKNPHPAPGFSVSDILERIWKSSLANSPLVAHRKVSGDLFVRAFPSRFHSPKLFMKTGSPSLTKTPWAALARCTITCSGVISGISNAPTFAQAARPPGYSLSVLSQDAFCPVWVLA